MDDLVPLDQKINLVRKQGSFSQLTDEEIEKLAELFVEMRFEPGTTIVTEGDPVDSVFLIIEGTADVRQFIVKDQDLKIESVATLKPGDAIGLNETGFYSLSGKRTATVVAISEVLLLRLSLAEFHGFALAYSHVNEVMRKNARSVLGT